MKLMPNRELAAEISRDCQISDEDAERVADYIEAGEFVGNIVDFDYWLAMGHDNEWFGER